MRARMAILLSGQCVQLREVLLRDKPAELRNSSAKATVPVLVFDDQHVIDESLTIMQWAAEQNQPANWMPYTAAMGKWITKNDTQFKADLDRYKYPDRYTNTNPANHYARAMVFLDQLADLLRDQDFLFGSAPCLADVAIFPFVRQFAAVDRDQFTKHGPKPVQNWLAHWLNSENFAHVMIKHAPWQNGDAPVFFPTIEYTDAI